MTSVSLRYKPALRLGLVWVVFLWLTAATTLDLGVLYRFYLYALAAYAVLLLLVLLRRPSSPTVADLLIIKWSLPFLFLFSANLCPLVWRWRWGWHL